jgi:RNA polymerase sigma-70 factor (ECF subfamily)
MTGRELEELLKHHAPAARALALSVTGNASDADDAVQEALLAAVEHAGDVDVERSPKSWLLKVTHNKARDLMRRRKVREASDELEGVSAPVTNVDVDAVRRAFQKLPSQYRAAMHLAYYEDMPYADIAETLSMSVSAVKMTILRGRELLRAALKETR